MLCAANASDRCMHTRTENQVTSYRRAGLSLSDRCAVIWSSKKVQQMEKFSRVGQIKPLFRTTVTAERHQKNRKASSNNKHGQLIHPPAVVFERRESRVVGTKSHDLDMA